MFCEVGGVSIYYEARGEGFPVLMLHGYGIDHNVMIGCMEPVFEGRPGYRRIYIDLPGMGQSKAPDWLGNSDQVLDLVMKFSEKAIKGSFLLAGESYGGYIARGMVNRMPSSIAGLLLICPVMVGEREKRQLPPRTVFVRDDKLLAAIDPEDRKFFERMLLLQDRRRWERFQQDILPGRHNEDKVFLERLKKHGYECSFDVDKLPQPFDRPSLILAGRQDASVGYRDALQLIDIYSRSTFAVLDRAGHGLEVEQEGLFNALAGEWLDRVEEYFQNSP
ncbi:MAG TPA: alpha/beta hydrolase [Methanocella sp.]|uniref:alpha/beta fold hydrolase n=1 Tax=Methanocella sp. TaxID=2052833 RepID=UPI002C4F7818|nr:alpha/beta hydrolase [Methanocella sp.]HTY90318.1 alpha/beta hydrolase [Methanocella sp.]